ncbi:MAG: ion transporter [Clostridiaceae bacterium BRH_c20a]|nr:MAG: ion transporter [Clostridiaceae bacterium BRH_c20a]
MANKEKNNHFKDWRHRLYVIIFRADTPAGKAFDVALIISIILSTLVVLLESIETYKTDYNYIFLTLEWFFTILFTIEFILRIVSANVPKRYVASFFGIVDFASILPTYISLFIPGAHIFIVIRILRLLRLFRIFKMVRYVQESAILLTAIKASKPKITVFILTILTVCVIVGSLMYIIEGPENGYLNIPVSMYWVIVTITTVGYGDISPQTPLGQIIASALMILAYGVLAVPTGIISYEIARASMPDKVATKVCQNCSVEGHDPDASFCNRCGDKL